MRPVSSVVPVAANVRALRFLYLTVILDVLAFGIVVPVLPSLVVTFLHGDTVRASNMWGLFGSAYAAAQFLCSPSIRDRARPLGLVGTAAVIDHYHLP